MGRPRTTPNPTRESRIAAIREQVRSGAYRVDAEAVAEAMLRLADWSPDVGVTPCVDCGADAPQGKARCSECRRRVSGGRKGRVAGSTGTWRRLKIPAPEVGR